ncbi:fumarate/nitrate reduction transcriptional regulator Fnr [Agarilytica rhodophyticola]|uniref:fumarate/nitrate reduction transcriptional regulator Fnr n=1 Tax=Agarilytica rhodophyticola TaxID=1737490 RepID=UPI000B3483C4|nr:fumarate/nitrate reduction transcriptional regulator Fnr [Agarilytica rhodophyticola]
MKNSADKNIICQQSSHHVNCTECRLGSICLPISLELDDVQKLDNIIQRSRPIQKTEHVYRAGEQFKSVYALRSGAIKAFTLTEDGLEQITGFYLPGEIFGMDGLTSDAYSNSAVALSTSSVCEIPFSHFEELSTQMPSLQRRFFQLMSKEITNDQQLISVLNKNNAVERIAAFLLSIAARNEKQGLSAREFHLPMSRSDIGNFLGLTIETVSRVFTRLHKSNIIKTDKKYIEILDLDALKGVSISTCQ